VSYDTPAPRDEEPDEKITVDGVPTDDALPETEPSDPNATDTGSAGAD
jgi:hypothetical protein